MDSVKSEVMLALWERSPRSVGELASVLALDPGTLSPLLKRWAMTTFSAAPAARSSPTLGRTVPPNNVKRHSSPDITLAKCPSATPWGAAFTAAKTLNAAAACSGGDYVRQ